VQNGCFAVHPCCRLLGARPSGRLGVSKPRNLEYSANAEGASDIEAP